jgi:hypothetical protein
MWKNTYLSWTLDFRCKQLVISVKPGFFSNEKWIKEKIKQCLCDQFQQNWKDDLQTCSKAINYRIFKNTFGFEDYFNILDENDFFGILQISIH